MFELVALAPSSEKPLNYDDYIRSAKWRNTSDLMKRYVGYVCQRCKIKFHAGQLDTHHLTYKRLGREKLTDLAVLCRVTCHPIADGYRVHAVRTRRAERWERNRHTAGQHTYLSKRYGDGYGAFEHQGMDDEFNDWLRNKHYRETGVWDESI